MKEFTFAVITYNQRGYIVEHLESVKRQIQMYGHLYQVDFVLSDDGSKDDTVSLAKAWLAENRELFRDVTVLAAPQNQGIVPNYLTALKHVKTCKFVILAGDDFYYQNDVAAAAYAGQFVVSSTLRLWESGLGGNYTTWWQKEYLLTGKNRLRKKLLKRMEYQMCVESPAVFWDSNLADGGMYEALAPYQWIEDVPLMCYLLQKQSLQAVALDYPLVVYRMSEGVSLNTKHEKMSVFDQEALVVRQNLQPKWNAPLFGMRQEFVRRVMKFLLCGHPKLRTFDANMALKPAQAYVDEIKKAAAEWLTRNGGQI